MTTSIASKPGFTTFKLDEQKYYGLTATQIDRKLISRGGRPSKTDKKPFIFLLQSLMSSSYYGFVGLLKCNID